MYYIWVSRLVKALTIPQNELSADQNIEWDFRRKEGTPGFNSHPDGGDARVEFILAQVDPDGNLTDGIVRLDMNSVQLPPSPPERGGRYYHNVNEGKQYRLQ